MTPPLPWTACSSTGQCFWWKNVFWYPIKSSPGATWGHFFLSYPCYLGKRNPAPPGSPASFQAVAESGEVSPEPPFFQAEHPQLPQPLLTGFVLQTLHQPHFPSLDSLQPLNVFLAVRGPELDTGFKVWPHQHRGTIPAWSCWPHYGWSRPGCPWPPWPPGHCWLMSSCCQQHFQVLFWHFSSHSSPAHSAAGGCCDLTGQCLVLEFNRKIK